MVEMIRARSTNTEAKRENRPSQTQKTGPSQSISSPIEQILFLQRTIGNQAVGKLIKSGVLQAKLRIGQPGDIYEQEADRVAEQVMRMPEPQVSKETKVSNPARNNSIQRKCPGCKKGTKIGKEEEEEKLQKKEAAGLTPEVTPELESSISAIRGGGQPLPESVRAYYEPRFGHDFSQVRMHTDSKAAEAARAVNANAYTVGHDVVFGSGRFAPRTPEGRRLIAHELTHVVQQGKASSSLYVLQRDKGPSTEFLRAGWSDVNELGIAYKEGTESEGGGVVLDNAPVAGNRIRWLEQNTKVFILKEKKGNTNSYAVSAINPQGASGEFGYAPISHIWRNLPDPDADVLKIKPGQWPIKIAIEYYAPKGFKVWGKDERYVVNALVWVNQQAHHNAKGPSGISKEAVSDSWYTAQSTAGIYIWLPGVDFMKAIFEKVRKEGGGTGSLTADLWFTLKDIGQWIAYGIAFVGGLVHGFFKSLWDAVSGLATGVKDVIVSLFSGHVLSDVKELWETLKKITWKDIKEAVSEFADHWEKELKSSSTWVAGHAHGYLTGYIMAEAAQLLLTGGMIAEAKAALWGSRIGKAIKETRAFKALEEGIQKVGKVKGAVKKTVGTVVSAVAKSKPFVILADATRWVGAALLLSAETISELTLPAINRLRTLSDDALEVLKKFAEPFKRVILGCASHCKVDLDVIKTYLAGLTGKAAKSIKKLETIDDILAALPEKMEKSLIKSKLTKHPAFIEAFKKAELTAEDLAVIEKFLTPADLADAASAYRTFTRTLSSLIPAKVGRDIEKLNAIAEAIVLLEPRWGAAFKGPMFESFAKLHLGRFRNLTFSRATWQKATYRSLSKATRTSDGFIESSGALWEFKHTIDKVPIDQVDDYFKILTRGMESAEGQKAKSVNFLFATKDGAEANADLVKKGFNVHYVTPPDVVTKLVP